MPVQHPHPDDAGNAVIVQHPLLPTPVTAFDDPLRLATVIPAGPTPAVLNGIPLTSWRAVPTESAAWAAVSGQMELKEPPFVAHPGTQPAAGVVILEPDGRVWLVAPSNGFAGYKATFPKGHVDSAMAMQATAIREAYEETGLQVEIVDFLGDFNRTLTRTRYYLARRVGGTPADMGWESQAVHLVPMAQLLKMLNQPRDHAIVALLLSKLADKEN